MERDGSEHGEAEGAYFVLVGVAMEHVNARVRDAFVDKQCWKGQSHQFREKWRKEKVRLVMQGGVRFVT